MADDLDYYALLGVAPDAAPEAIRGAFRRLALRYHPDLAGDESLRHMQLLTLAYRTLSDSDARRRYDAERGLRSTWDGPVAAATTAHPSAPASSAAPHWEARPRRGSVAVQGRALRMGATLFAADATPVASMALTPDGRLLAAGHLDGSVRVWDAAGTMSVAELTFGPAAGAGVLQGVRLSPRGMYASAWGLQLGTRVWRVAGGEPLWTVGFSSPVGLMDLTLRDEPATVRLALPDAPPAIGDDEPFRWAHDGRGGTAIFTRALGGPVSPAEAIPLRCVEPRNLRGIPPNDRGRVQLRQLSSDGRRLLTCAAPPTRMAGSGRTLHLWDLDHRSLRGTPRPRRVTVIAAQHEDVRFPIAASPDLSHIAASLHGVALRLYPLEPAGPPLDLPAGMVPDDAALAVAPRGEAVALAREAMVELFRVADRACVQRWEFGDAVSAIAFAPCRDGAVRLAVGLRNGVIEVWEA